MEPKTGVLAVALLMVEMELKMAFNGGSIKSLRKGTYSGGKKSPPNVNFSAAKILFFFFSGGEGSGETKIFSFGGSHYVKKKKKKRGIWRRERNMCVGCWFVANLG